MFKYTTSFLRKLEVLVKEAGFILRYEKGNFIPGYCILQDKQVIVVNKYYELEARISALLEIIEQLNFSEENLSESSRNLYYQIRQKELNV